MWFDCTKTALKKLKVAYNNSLRRFMRLPWRNSASEMFVNLNIRSFDEMLRIFTFGFMSRVIVSNNLLISNIYNSPCRLYSNIWSWWDSLLHINRVKVLEKCTKNLIGHSRLAFNNHESNIDC